MASRSDPDQGAQWAARIIVTAVTGWVISRFAGPKLGALGGVVLAVAHDMADAPLAGVLAEAGL